MTTSSRPAPNAAVGVTSEMQARADARSLDIVRYAVAGVALGIILVKAEVVSWYRIQEMFRFQSFHMYGVLGSAMVTALISLEILRRTHARTVTGEPIEVPPKQMGSGTRYWVGGFIFGLGWALTGACPGPLYALIGAGSSVYIVVAIAALIGTRTYGVLRPHLPH